MFFSAKLENKVFSKDRVLLFQNQMENEVENIGEYLRYLEEMKKGDQSLAINKWNMNVKSIHDQQNA